MDGGREVPNVDDFLEVLLVDPVYWDGDVLHAVGGSSGGANVDARLAVLVNGDGRSSL